MNAQTFADALLRWYDHYGRSDLPWREQISAYRVWVSEIMLQQTQVQTVIPYFHRFLQQFPNLEALANATLDEVLHLWTGLGYYARARHLHQTAQYLQTHYHGQFPASLEALEKLPGIGRSTAGAILAIAMQQKSTILDGNVKRVLARFQAIEGWPGSPEISKQLWSLAEKLTPDSRVDDYTQAIMDLGATICTRTNPRCDQCPVHSGCEAYAHDKTATLPSPKPTRSLPSKKITWLVLCRNNAVLLEKRPPTGIWGGLWGFPEYSGKLPIKEWCETQFRCQIEKKRVLPRFRHSFSHFHLDVTPVQLLIKKWPNQIMDSENTVWYRSQEPIQYGLASPVKRLLLRLMREDDV